MTNTENAKIAHHTFRPWRVVGDQRIVAAESAWKNPIKWNRTAVLTCSECGSQNTTHNAPTGVSPSAMTWDFECICGSNSYGVSSPRVLVDVDVFEDWRGEVRDSHGNVWHVCKHGHWSPLPYVYARGHECLHCDGLARVATIDDVRARLFSTIDATPNLNWLIVTSHPENVRRMWQPYEWHACVTGDCPHDVASECDPNTGWRENVWLGVSIACRADLRLLDELRKCRDLCAKIVVSAEPLLDDLGTIDLTGIDWMIVGGESGPKARPCDIAHVRSLVRQCRAAGVPCFVKQVGAHVIDRNDAGFLAEWDDGIGWSESVEVEEHIDGFRTDYQGAPVRVRTRDRKGGDPAEWPEDLRVREVPS